LALEPVQGFLAKVVDGGAKEACRNQARAERLVGRRRVELCPLDSTNIGPGPNLGLGPLIFAQVSHE
jgi:hypothetical protein